MFHPSLRFRNGRHNFAIYVLALTVIVSWNAIVAATAPEATGPKLSQTDIKLPLTFEPNQGQTNADVKFLSRGRGYHLFLTANEMVLAFTKGRSSEIEEQNMKSMFASVKPESGSQAAVIRMKLVGSKRKPQISGVDQIQGKSNYLIGNDPMKWHRNIPNYARVKYEDVYPGVDLVFYGNEGQVEHDFILAPGANPNTIALQFEGANKLDLDDSGDLLLYVSGGIIRFTEAAHLSTGEGRTKRNCRCIFTQR